MADYERTRLVVLGGKGVGKSCIVKRFLENTYTDKYRSTIEDLYSKEFDLGHTTLKVRLKHIHSTHLKTLLHVQGESLACTYIFTVDSRGLKNIKSVSFFDHCYSFILPTTSSFSVMTIKFLKYYTIVNRKFNIVL